jgi:flagellar FliL protein
MAEKKATEEAAPKTGKAKLLVIMAAALLLLGGGGGTAAYFMGLFGGGAEAAPSDEHGAADSDAHASATTGDGENAHASGSDHGESGPAPTPKLPFAFIDMPELLVNLQPEGKRMHFLRLRLALEVDPGKSAETVKALTPASSTASSSTCVRWRLRRCKARSACRS